MTLNITNNTLKHRFEVEVGSKTAFLNYLMRDKTMTLTHTEVPSSLSGRGVGTALAKAALDYAVQQGLRVVPQCSFVADFVNTHSQYQSVVVAPR
ncbi:GNAT family N-acetyltransferase [Acidobacterium sp. S8]|uniref:GNAT family N-acetyltransferase n=1 Tax=Acidobacterium sp. S8 TaxID=1641854 RepID=UPI00131B4BFC|nr:GNAT family N-acetyltransferase [Acidobacterium sp. S8]